MFCEVQDEAVLDLEIITLKDNGLWIVLLEILLLASDVNYWYQIDIKNITVVDSFLSVLVIQYQELT